MMVPVCTALDRLHDGGGGAASIIQMASHIRARDKPLKIFQSVLSGLRGFSPATPPALLAFGGIKIKNNSVPSISSELG